MIKPKTKWLNRCPNRPLGKVILATLLLLFFLAACGGKATEEVDTTALPVDAINPRLPGLDPGIATISAQIENAPNDASLYASRAELWYEKNNFDNAIVDLRIALELDSLNIGYHYILTDIYLDYFQSLLALKTIERAVSIDPENIESLLRLAEVRIILKRYKEALAAINEVTRLKPREPDAYLLLGQIFAEQGDTTRAISSLQEAVEINPDMMDGWITLGRLHAAKGSNLAERYFETAYRLDSNSIYAVHARADFLRDQGEIAEAIRLYKRTSAIDRQYVAGHFNAGLLYLEMDSIEMAFRELNIVIKNDPIHIQGYFFRGYAQEMMGDLAAAKKDYETALRFSPDYQLALDGLARVR